jgi:D-alanyl-D-alanine carboxypeptidase
MTPSLPRIVGVALAAGALLIGVTACGSDSDLSDDTSGTTAAPSGETAFADSMASPIATWRTSFQTSSMTFTVPGTVVGASVGDGPVELAASGDAVLGTTPMGVDDAFHIGSMTKLFTAALIMQLDQEGFLSLDDTIDTWFPQAPNGSKITVLMLLEHESGLYELDMSLVGTATNQEIVDNVFEQAPIAEPGTEYQYLNAGYIILGRIAEEATEEPYDQLVHARLIEGFHLESTYLDGYGEGPQAVDGYDLSCAGGATGSDCLGLPSTPQAIESSPQWKGAWSAGGMVSTARDQATWLRALVAGDVVDQAHKQLMQDLTPLSSAYYSAAYSKAGITAVQLGEGAGLATWAVPGVGDCHGHAGSIPGSNGIAAYCPDEDLSVAILNNANPAGTTPGYPGLVELTPAALGALGG